MNNRVNENIKCMPKDYTTNAINNAKLGNHIKSQKYQMSNHSTARMESYGDKKELSTW